MQLALVNNIISYPKKNIKGICPLCKVTVNSKCGSINVHHWAHNKDQGCDSWSEPETFWHKKWKEIFPIENREKIISKNNKKHFADIYTESGIVIELQNSSIKTEVIKQREDFYGTKMMWVINGNKYRSHIKMFVQVESYYQWVSLCRKNISEFLDKIDECDFEWSYPIRSWANSKRPVFLDIDKDFILWVKKGIGTKKGLMKVIKKQVFLNKYGGDYQLYSTFTFDKNIVRYSSIIDKINNVFWNSLFKDYSTYSYPPELALEVVDNVSERTQLRKVVWDKLYIPNGNSKGMCFCFCCNDEDNSKYKVFIYQSVNTSIYSEVINYIISDKIRKTYSHKGTNYRIEYIATIPLKDEDTYFKDKLLRESLIYNLQ